jgi:hypothetical protein
MVHTGCEEFEQIGETATADPRVPDVERGVTVLLPVAVVERRSPRLADRRTSAASGCQEPLRTQPIG